MILKKIPEQYIDEKAMDKSLILDRGVRFSYDEMQEVPEGRFTVMRDGVKMESLYLTNPDSDRLMVVLDGSRVRAGKVVKVPKFDMWSWQKKLGVNYLSIEDPMYFTFDDPILRSGWYYGTRTIDYREYTADLIRRICELKGIPLKKVIIYGLSSGATAAGFVASLLGECTAVMNNPQINFKDFSYVTHFMRVTGQDIIGASENGGRNDLAARMKEPHSCTFFFMFNALSEHDRDFHVKKLSSTYDTALDFGLNRLDERVYCFLYLAEGVPSAHTTTPPPPLLRSIINAVFELETTPLETMKSTFSLLNDLYYDYYLCRRDLFLAESKLKKLPAYVSDAPKAFLDVNSFYTTLRLDIKNVGTEENDVKILKISDPSARELTPEWFSKDQQGTGHLVLSESGDLTIRLQCIHDGELKLALRSRDVKKKDHTRAVIQMDLQKVLINDTPCLSSRKVVTHGVPFRYSLPVRDGDIVTLQAQWTPHDVRK